MDRVQLFVVEERFQLSSIGLTLVPDFPLPNGRWKNIEEEVTVVVPGGEQVDTVAQFNLTHFNFGGRPAADDRRWRIVVSLPNLEKAAVPVGSLVLVSHMVYRAVTVGDEG